jgi:hypothetical protein
MRWVETRVKVKGGIVGNCPARKGAVLGIIYFDGECRIGKKAAGVVCNERASLGDPAVYA